MFVLRALRSATGRGSGCMTEWTRVAAWATPCSWNMENIPIPENSGGSRMLRGFIETTCQKMERSETGVGTACPLRRTCGIAWKPGTRRYQVGRRASFGRYCIVGAHCGVARAKFRAPPCCAGGDGSRALSWTIATDYAAGGVEMPSASAQGMDCGGPAGVRCVRVIARLCLG